MSYPTHQIISQAVGQNIIPIELQRSVDFRFPVKSNLPIINASTLPVTQLQPQIHNINRQAYEQFDEETKINPQDNTILSETSFNKYLFWSVLYFYSGLILLLLASCVQEGCSNLLKWARLLALFLLFFSILKLGIMGWAFINKNQINELQVQKLTVWLYWLGIAEFFLLCFLSIGLSFTLAYTKDIISCEYLYKVGMLYAISSWIIIIFMIFLFGSHYMRRL